MNYYDEPSTIMSLKSFAQWIPFGQVLELSAEELWQLMEQSEVQILDVRTRQEWLRSRIQGAINLPITQFNEENVNALNLNKNIKTITICLSAHRSIPAVRQLNKMGFTDCQQLAGGMLAWWKQGLGTTSGEAR